MHTRIGLSVMLLETRRAATIAMAAATLHAMSGGRFVLGLGASTPQLAEGLHDTPFAPPVPRMHRMVTQIRALLRGERIPRPVTTPARALKLNMPPAPALPIHIAALGDAMTRLADELADAWVPFLYLWSQLATGVANSADGERERRGHGAQSGAANGRNPIAIVVPCHRVIGANGMLTGYASGLNIKAVNDYLLVRQRRRWTRHRASPSRASTAPPCACVAAVV